MYKWILKKMIAISRGIGFHVFLIDIQHCLTPPSSFTLQNMIYSALTCALQHCTTFLLPALFVIPHCPKTLFFSALFVIPHCTKILLFSTLFVIPHCTKTLLFSALFVIPHCTKSTLVFCTLRNWYSAWQNILVSCTLRYSAFHKNTLGLCTLCNWYSALHNILASRTLCYSAMLKNNVVLCTLRTWYSELHNTALFMYFSEQSSSCTLQNRDCTMYVYLLSFLSEKKILSSTYLICPFLSRWRELCGYEVTYTLVGSWYT